VLFARLFTPSNVDPRPDCSTTVLPKFASVDTCTPYDVAVLTFHLIGIKLTGSASERTISGPIGIASVAGSAARTHSARLFLGFIGLLSLNLGIFNLLPVPILDGGVITLLLIEGLIGRDLSLGIKEKIIQAGFVFLILLMGFVVINDLSKIVNFNGLFR
jgi:regulator of sigma E protease